MSTPVPKWDPTHRKRRWNGAEGKVPDRAVGGLVFGNARLMDYELIGGDAREAIFAKDAKHGIKRFLPPQVPFGSNQWPTLITPGPGPASLAGLH